MLRTIIASPTCTFSWSICHGSLFITTARTVIGFTVTRMTTALHCLLAPAVLAVSAGAEEAADNQPAVDKSAFHLFNPTPTLSLRELTRDGPGKTESPYTVDAGHFQIEMDLVSYTFDQRQFTKDLGFRGIGQADALRRLQLGSSLVGSRGRDAERPVQRG